MYNLIKQWHLQIFRTNPHAHAYAILNSISCIFISSNMSAVRAIRQQGQATLQTKQRDCRSWRGIQIDDWAKHLHPLVPHSVSATHSLIPSRHRLHATDSSALALCWNSSTVLAEVENLFPIYGPRARGTLLWEPDWLIGVEAGCVSRQVD